MIEILHSRGKNEAYQCIHNTNYKKNKNERRHEKSAKIGSNLSKPKCFNLSSVENLWFRALFQLQCSGLVS